MRSMIAAALMIVLYACSGNAPAAKLTTLDKNWLDSIKKKSDTSWVKPYRNEEFAVSEYYIDKTDSIVTQVMKDRQGMIRQIIIARYDQIRLFFAEYFANGQLMASLPLDSAGHYNGNGKYYYENGRVKSEGSFSHGLFNGKWKNYDTTGRLLNVDEYDSNGQLRTNN